MERLPERCQRFSGPIQLVRGSRVLRFPTLESWPTPAGIRLTPSERVFKVLVRSLLPL